MQAIDALLGSAAEAFRRGDLADAEVKLRQVTNLNRGHFPALNMLAVVLTLRGQIDQAIVFYRRALEVDPNSEITLFNFALLLGQGREYSEAEKLLSRAVQINAKSCEAFNARGAIRHEMKRYDEALADFDVALLIQPAFTDALANRGTTLFALGRGDEAKIWFEKALSLDAHNFSAHLGFGNVALDRRDLMTATASFETALQINPQLPAAWLGLGNACVHLNDFINASAAFDKALALDPHLTGALIGQANIQFALGKLDDAMVCLERAVKVEPDHAEIWLMIGSILVEQRHMEKARAAYDKAFALQPNLQGLAGARLMANLRACQWDGADEEALAIRAQIRAGELVSDPFVFLSIGSTSDEQLNLGQEWSKTFAKSADAVAPAAVRQNGKIRLGYLSGDFHNHATGLLTAGLFEQHNREEFEVFAFSTGPNDGKALRARLEKGFDKFFDAAGMGDEQLIQLIQKSDIDILVDLKGYTTGARTRVVAARPARVQATYLGFPGTSGASFIDFAVVDEIVVPCELRPHFSEKLIYMPDCYQVTDDLRSVPATHARKSEYGLPEQAFVFCCFNNNFKMNSDVFSLWMRILTRCPHAVLWLLADNNDAQKNLVQAAIASGVAPSRLIFAERETLDRHMERHLVADLFLDTWPYNAHTTASDALWAGVPLITLPGEIFASRVSASLLLAADMPDLIAGTKEHYEELAVQLAHDPDKLSAVKSKLAQSKMARLFNTKLFTRHLEAGYKDMYRQYVAGGQYSDIYVRKL